MFIAKKKQHRNKNLLPKQLLIFFKIVIFFPLSKRFMRGSSEENDCWKKQDETGDGWILPQDHYDFNGNQLRFFRN
jgi:hypothetical protein